MLCNRYYLFLINILYVMILDPRGSSLLFPNITFGKLSISVLERRE